MVTNKTKRTFWKESQILLNDCRTYNKIVLSLRGALQKAQDRYQAMFGAGLLVGLLFGLSMAHILFYLAGRL